MTKSLHATVSQMFKLHPQLEKDCFVLGSFPLCKLLLSNDANYPWFILVPKRESITEIFQLSKEEQQQLIKESSYFSEILTQLFNADKLNIAAYGNIVNQLHIHHIVRYKKDAAWPAPIMGVIPKIVYTDEQTTEIRNKIHSVLKEGFVPES